MAGKGPFCRVDAGARLFSDEKVALSRGRARLGALAEPIKKSIARHVDAEPGIVDWAFSLNFPFFLVRKVKDLGNNTSQRAFSGT